MLYTIKRFSSQSVAGYLRPIWNLGLTYHGAPFQYVLAMLMEPMKPCLDPVFLSKSPPNR
jgi:hypothetical protein